MRHLATLLALALPLTLAAPAVAQGGPPGPHHREALQRMRTLRAVSLANRLALDESEALRLNEIMKRYDEARADLREDLRRLMQRLDRLAAAPQADREAVDQAVQEILEIQRKMAQTRQDEIQALVKGLDPRRTAQLLIFYRDFPREVRRLMHGPGPQRRGPASDEAQAPPVELEGMD